MGKVETDEQGRSEPPLDADEAMTLLGFLDFLRPTLEWEYRRLNEDQLQAALPPTSMTLGGLLKHLAHVEDEWFTEVVAGSVTAEPWDSVDWKSNPDWDWSSAASDTGGDRRGLWTERVERSRAVADQRLGRDPAVALDQTYSAWGGQTRISFRWVLVHMIEQYARHNGHADLIRESIDGQTGE